MKKILIIVVSAVLIGSTFAIYMFSNINEKVETAMNQNDVYAFQVGVYSVYDNAKNAASKYPNSYIYQDADKYRVFLAIYQDQEIVEYMKNYYTNNDTDVYLKKIEVTNEFLEQLNKYETLLKKTNSQETYISANKNILGAFEKTL